MIHYAIHFPKGDNLKGIAIVTYFTIPNTKNRLPLKVAYTVTKKGVFWEEPDEVLFRNERGNTPWIWRTGGHWQAKVSPSKITIKSLGDNISTTLSRMQ
jgi:hypothetical protein